MFINVRRKCNELKGMKSIGREKYYLQCSTPHTSTSTSPLKHTPEFQFFFLVGHIFPFHVIFDKRMRKKSINIFIAQSFWFSYYYY